MSIKMNPAIGELNPESLCYSIYKHLYSNFFNAQDKKDTDHPFGVVEGDETSIRLHNTAYGFAEAISMGVSGGDPSAGGSVLLEYLKKAGGNMTGMLTANYGFEAGKDNNRILWIDKNDEGVYSVRLSGNLEIGASSLIIGGAQIISYDNSKESVIISGKTVDLKNASLISQGEIIIGSKNTGVYLSGSSLLFKGKPVFHEGNANLATIDWQMKNANVKGDLSVTGKTQLSGSLEALNGVVLGANKKGVLSIADDTAHFSGYISFKTGFGIKIDTIPVLIRSNTKDIQLGAVGGDLLLGSVNTNKIRLQSHITSDDGEYTIITKYGGGYFPDSLTVRHGFGNVLLSSFRTEAKDEGIILHKRLYFENSSGAHLSGDKQGLIFASYVEYIDAVTQVRTILKYDTKINFIQSTSLHKPNRKTSTQYNSTSADFFLFNKSLEAIGHIGIDNSFTRLMDGALFFTGESYLLGSALGIKHYGNAFFLSNLSSELFSSGFAGSGWAIQKNKMTNNISATFDELTIRKKMRIYELEVQKISVTNGSLWISDNCQGDTVEKL